MYNKADKDSQSSWVWVAGLFLKLTTISLVF